MHCPDVHGANCLTPFGSCQCVCHGSEWHYGTCQKIVGPRGGVTYRVEQWRANGATKTWVTRPGHFRIPIMHGLRDHWYLTHENAADFHRASDCPV